MEIPYFKCLNAFQGGDQCESDGENKKMRNQKREHLLHIDKEKRAQKEHEIWSMISSNVDPGFCRKYGNICYNWRIKNSI